MEPQDSTGQSKSAGYQTKVITPEEIVKREHLLDFIREFVKAMMQSGLYTSDHPQSKKAKEGLYGSFRQLLGDSREVSFLSRFEHDVGKDIFIDGILDETTSLTSVMTSAQSDLFLPKFTDYFYRRGLVSFSLKNETTAEELNRFVDIMGESHGSREGSALKKGEELTRELVDNSIVNVSTVFDDDVIKFGRGIPWRVEMALFRLRKDLRVVPLFHNLSPDQMTEIKLKVIQDIMRPIGYASNFVDMLLNAQYAIKDIENLQDVDIESEIIKSIRPSLLREVAEKFSDKIMPSKDAPSVSKESTILVTLMLKKLGERMIEMDLKDDFQVLYRLHTMGILSLDQLPQEIRTQIRIERMTDDFLEYPGRYTGAVRNFSDIKSYQSAVDMVARIFPELIRRGELGTVSEFVETLSNHKNDPDPRFKERAVSASGILDQLCARENLEQLKNTIDISHKEAREKALNILNFMGSKAISVLMDMLATSRNPDVRKSICQLLAASKISPPFIEEELKKHEQPWFLIRNLVGVLGLKGNPEDAKIVSNFLKHDHHKVREEALVALHKLLGQKAEAALVHALNDKDTGVVARVVALLGSMKSRHPMALEFYIKALNLESQLPESLKIQSCNALGRLGEMELPGGVKNVELLRDILSAGQSGKFFGFVKTGTELYPAAIRREAALALGRIGSPKAIAVLKSYLKDKDPKVREAVELSLRREK